jgi:hypothetical protein
VSGRCDMNTCNSSDERVAKWQSNAQWPLDVYRGMDGKGISTDTHHSESAANYVCKLLERQGFGSEGKHFPIRTWVSEAQP